MIGFLFYDVMEPMNDLDSYVQEKNKDLPNQISDRLKKVTRSATSREALIFSYFRLLLNLP